MSNDLLKQLDEKITTAIETIELSRMEITELKEQNDELENRYVDWEDRLSALIEKFEQLEDEEIVEIEAESEAPIQKVEEENIEEIGAEENDADEQAEEILADWGHWKKKFKILIPPSEKIALGLESSSQVLV